MPGASALVMLRQHCCACLRRWLDTVSAWNGSHRCPFCGSYEIDVQ